MYIRQAAITDYDYNDDLSVVVCWQHSRIVDFLNILGADTVTSWGIDPEARDDDKDCFDVTWVCNFHKGGLSLSVYKQFDIDADGKPFYTHNRDHVWWNKTYPIRTHEGPYSASRTSLCSIS